MISQINTEKFAFVLVRPKSAGNIGSAARAIKNMGFADLRLVAPTTSPKRRAAAVMAVHANDVLDNARIFSDLHEAIKDCTLTVGTTCRGGLYRSSVRPLREAAAELTALAPTNRIAVIFGPEDTGLTNYELKICERLITIPTSIAYPSLNLAQAVVVMAYELMMAADITIRGAAQTPEFAAAAEVDTMLERMRNALMAIGFLTEDNPEHIMFALSGIFGRSGLFPRELDILNGIARQTQWVAEGGYKVIAEKRRAGKRLR